MTSWPACFSQNGSLKTLTRDYPKIQFGETSDPSNGLS